MQSKASLLRRIVRSYTFHSPIDRGKYRLSNLAIKYSSHSADEQVVKTTDGRSMIVDARNESYQYIYFVGSYEPVITKILSSIVRPGDICFDIGANMGWYTTLFQKLVGQNGQVHSFEPVPPTFERLKRNVSLNEPPKNVRLNNLALGDEEKDVELHIFPDLPDGHASLATFDRTDYEAFPSRMSTLDSYLAQNNVGDVSLVKIDVEGSELMLLRGASRLFEQKTLPVFEIEMARATSTPFKYLPNDLIEYIRAQADYRFFAIDEKEWLLREIVRFDDDDIGANVLCTPPGFDISRVSLWLDGSEVR